MNEEVLATDWNKVNAIATCIYVVLTGVYVFLVGAGLVYVRHQINEMHKARTLDAVLAIVKELQTDQAHIARNYIFSKLPQKPDGLPDCEIQEHLRLIRPALIAFHTVGYLLQERYVDPAVESIKDYLWPIAWRCWKRTEPFIEYECKRRNDKSYMRYFRYIYDELEKYRQQKGYSLPPP